MHVLPLTDKRHEGCLKFEWRRRCCSILSVLYLWAHGLFSSGVAALACTTKGVLTSSVLVNLSFIFLPLLQLDTFHSFQHYAGLLFLFDIIKQRIHLLKLSPSPLYCHLWVESTGGGNEEVLPHSLQRGEASSQQGDQQQTGEQQPWSPKEAPGKTGEVSTGNAKGTDVS